MVSKSCSKSLSVQVILSVFSSDTPLRFHKLIRVVLLKYSTKFLAISFLLAKFACANHAVNFLLLTY